ncbi:MAG: hypothetical protein AUJ52_08505 [Elusimicrobia bacterium CG1_02_63_36]|nr:MAG: hypothetical protein AUJ52_08505 [Elusimicrobia bacterium CG1_02_63_36]
MNRNPLFLALICLAAASLNVSAAGTQEKGGKPPPQESVTTQGRVDSSPEEFAKDFVETIGKRVGLEEGQKAKVRAVVDNSYKRNEKNWQRQAELLAELDAVGRELGKEIRTMYEEIRELLSHQQREAFDEMRVDLRRNPVKVEPSHEAAGGGGSRQ